MKQFETLTCGKWILAGEHAVLRGSSALVFPLPSARLHFAFFPNQQDQIDLELSGVAGAELDLLFWGVLEKACGLTQVRRSDLHGKVAIRNDIPVGAGLGASAAFCVAIARWFEGQGAITADKTEEFARELENLFHGESSGVDIAVAFHERPLKFTRGKEKEQLDLAWTPLCFLSYSGQRGVTRECVEKVKGLAATDPTRGAALDEQMKQAVSLAEKALQAPQEIGFELLKGAIETANRCFEGWGLVEGRPDRAAKALRSAGAIAVKPTGSGGGGYLLSLWDRAPAAEIECIPCFSLKDTCSDKSKERSKPTPPHLAIRPDVF